MKQNNKNEKVKVKNTKTSKTKKDKKINPVIVGAGPAGLFAGLTFVQNGFKPIIIEYETIEYMKVKLEWIDNMKNGVYSELVTPKNTLKSVLYKLLK